MEGFRAVGTRRLANPLRAFLSAATATERGKCQRHWVSFPNKTRKGAEPWVAIKRKFCAQEVMSTAGALVLASPSSRHWINEILQRVRVSPAHCRGKGCFLQPRSVKIWRAAGDALPGHAA